MRITKMMAKDIYGIGDSKEYDLSEKITGVFGKNGAGKSSFLNSLNFAVSGIKTPDLVHEGAASGAVMFETDNGLRVDRLAEKTQTGSVTVKNWLNRTVSSAQKVQKEIADGWSTQPDSLKILSSKDLENSLSKDAGRILLSYADDSLTEDEVRAIIKDMAAGHPEMHVSAETAEKIKIPHDTDWTKAKDLSAKAAKARRQAKADGRYYAEARKKISLSILGEGEPEIPVSRAKEELSEIAAEETAALNAKKQLDEYTKMKAHRDAVIKSISEKEELLRSSDTPADPEALKKKKEELITAGRETGSSLAAARAVISSLEPVYDRLGTGRCPLSDSIKCSTDMSETRNRIGKDIKKAESDIKILTEKMNRLKDEYDLVKKDLEKAEKAEALKKDIATLKKALPPEPAKPAVCESKDYKERKAYLNKIISNAEKKVQITQYDEMIKKEADRVWLTDFIAKVFSEQGPVVRGILDSYMSRLTSAAEKAEKETGVGIVFSYNDGLDIGYRINGGNIRPYSTLSSGEQMLAFLTVSDLLHRIASVPVLILDNLDRLDLDNLDRLLTLLDRVKDSYGNIILAGVDHIGVDEVLRKHGIINILENTEQEE